MCTGIELAMAASAAASVAGTGLSMAQQRSAAKRMNNEISAQNKLLSDQYADRQRKINAAKDEQARTANEIGSAQDAEFAKQLQLAKDKAKLFQDTAAQQQLQANSAEFQQAVENRNQLFRDTAPVVTPDFGSSNAGGTENRVLRSAAEKALLEKKDQTEGVVDAQSRMGALQDAQQKQGMLFRDLDTRMGDIAKDANASSNLLSAKLRLPEYRMGALGAAAGEQANMPYFRGQEPVYRTPNTLFADVLNGAGQLGMLYSFRQPKPVAGATP